MLNREDQELADYILRRVKNRVGLDLTWDELLATPVMEAGGVDTLNDLLQSGLVEIPEGTFAMSDRYHSKKDKKVKA